MPNAGETSGRETTTMALSTMATAACPGEPSSGWAHPAGVLWLSLVVGLLSSCSVDINNLRAPKATGGDAAIETMVEPDSAVDSDAGVPGDEDAPADTREGLADLSDDIGEASDVAGALRDGKDGKAPPDASPDQLVPDVHDDASDVALPSDGDQDTGGAGGDGSGGVRTGGASGSGTGGGGGSSGYDGADGGAAIDPDLVLWYKLDESSGTVAADSAGFGTGGHDGKVYDNGGSATFSTDCRIGSHALELAPGRMSGGGYATVPAPKALAPDAITVAFWVKLTANGPREDWERIFDFGTGTSATAPFFYMTARASDAPGSPIRFGISRSGNSQAAEQRLQATSALTASVWHHIAVVLPPGPGYYTGTLYIDGDVAATNGQMSLHLSDLATTTNNYLGRSQFAEDPFFNGSLDDFRVYKRALSQAEIAALYALR